MGGLCRTYGMGSMAQRAAAADIDLHAKANGRVYATACATAWNQVRFRMTKQKALIRGLQWANYAWGIYCMGVGALEGRLLLWGVGLYCLWFANYFCRWWLTKCSDD